VQEGVQVALLDAVEEVRRQFGGGNRFALQERGQLFDGFVCMAFLFDFIRRKTGVAARMLIRSLSAPGTGRPGSSARRPGSRRGDWFAGHVFAQAQGDVVHVRGQRVAQRGDAFGVDRLHLLGQRKNAIQLRQRGGALLSLISSWASLAMRFTSDKVRTWHGAD
jgi:hypothetical protein